MDEIIKEEQKPAVSGGGADTGTAPAASEGGQNRRNNRRYPKKHYNQKPGGNPQRETAADGAPDESPAGEAAVQSDSRKRPQKPHAGQQPKALSSSQEKALAALRQYEEAKSGKNQPRRNEKTEGQHKPAQQPKEQPQQKKEQQPKKEQAQKKEAPQQKKEPYQQKKEPQKRQEKRGERKTDENRQDTSPVNAGRLSPDTSSNVFAPAAGKGFDFVGFSLSAEDDSYLDKMPPDPTLDEVFGTAPEKEPESAEGVEVVGVHFPQGGKVYWFGPNGIAFAKGDPVIVETARGTELGEIALGNLRVGESEIVAPLRSVIRKATPDDLKHEAANNEKCVDALRRCAEKVSKHKLDMKLVGAQYTFDNAKLIFYFTAAARVDFRELVKDLASEFHTRIELRQIGIRDEAKMLGGRGVCGRKLCCSVFLPGFAQVSVKMAKEQGLSLNSSKISGNCGRLMCCLRFEQSTYESELALMPPPDSIVDTPDGRGTVTEVRPVGYVVKVKLDDKQDQPPRPYHLNDITVIKKAAYRHDDDKDTDENLPD